MRSRRLFGALAGAFSGVLLYSASTLAADSVALPLVSVERQGYAFEYPRVLAEQRLFGIAHGVSLLATACLDVAAQSDATAEAYTHWYEQQQATIETLKDELAVFYFGRYADEATWEHIVGALKLRDKLDLAPDTLDAACKSLPEALAQPRYDLGALFQLEAALAGMTTAVRAETHTAACAARLPESERAGLNDLYAEWQRREEDAITTAQTQLQLYWQKTGTPGKVEDWQKTLKQRYAQPTAVACKKLPEWLASSDSSLAQSFAPAPTTTASDESAATDNTVSAVSDTRPVAAPLEDASAPADPAANAAGTSGPYLFDYLMRLFDERPYEDAARQPGKQPARSQRTHP